MLLSISLSAETPFEIAVARIDLHEEVQQQQPLEERERTIRTARISFYFFFSTIRVVLVANYVYSYTGHYDSN